MTVCVVAKVHSSLLSRSSSENQKAGHKDGLTGEEQRDGELQAEGFIGIQPFLLATSLARAPGAGCPSAPGPSVSCSLFSVSSFTKLPNSLQVAQHSANSFHLLFPPKGSRLV